MALWGRSAYRQKTVTSRLTKHRHTSPLNLLNFFIFFSLHLCALFSHSCALRLLCLFCSLSPCHITTFLLTGTRPRKPDPSTPESAVYWCNLLSISHHIAIATGMGDEKPI
ncbi:ASB_HP2_G0029830.mRNA.1.CDS.1 [Saccharomyces cerevisiae]|nr:hypothetical protein FOB22_003308 [Saccharomyces cerevisiae]CAI5290337.1 ASB_HP2_G0029830.mRNA.1.CDS.1 [Saccharomyces cerevisiae]CAI6590985.1 ASB_HP1_G0029560.mRNA.1.CDS.1 [Saccharomyces cerevisiae]CAI6594032.1 ASB_HP2_G0029830.mRNA.1.CDS.1 [Saccharomyces cerevisiae]